MKTTMIATVVALVLCSIAYVCVDGEEVSAAATKIGTVDPTETDPITYYIYDDGTARANKLATTAGEEVVIAGTVSWGDDTHEKKDYTVTSISSSFASNNSKITKVTIPASVTEIKQVTYLSSNSGAFSGCTNLTTVVFEPGSKLETLPAFVFFGCRSLSTIELPEGLKSLGDSAFGNKGSNYCYSLTELTLPASLETISNDALPHLAMTIKVADGSKNFTVENGILYNADKTTLIQAFDYAGDITIPSTVKTIGTKAFYIRASDAISETDYKSWGLDKNPIKDPSFGTITVPNTVEKIDSYAFKVDSGKKTPYQNLVLPSQFSVTLGTQAYANNPLVTEMYIGKDTTKSVAKDAYSGCANIGTAYILTDKISTQYRDLSMKKLVLSASLASVTSENVFVGAKNLTTITYEGAEAEAGTAKFPSTLTKISSNFIEGAQITTLDLSNFSGEIPTNCFNNLSVLTKLTLGSEITMIGANSFKGLSLLEEVTIPAKVTSIGSKAFSDCPKLTSVVLLGDTAIGANCFSGSVTTEGNLKVLKVTSKATGVDSTLKYVMDVDLPKAEDGTVTDTKVTIGKEVISIADGCLVNKGITEIAVEEENKFFAVKNGALYSADLSKLIAIPSKAISEGKFVVPASVTVIATYAADGLSALHVLEFEDGSKLTEIGMYAFRNSGLTGFTAPSTLTTVADYAFYMTASMVKADFSAVKGDLSLGSECFEDSSLTEVLFSDNFVELKDSAFLGTKLKNFVLNNGKLNYGVLKSCSDLESVVLGKSAVIDSAYSSILGGSTPKVLVLLTTDAVAYSNTRAYGRGAIDGMTIAVSEDCTIDYSALVTGGYTVVKVNAISNGDCFVIPTVEHITVKEKSRTDDSITFSYTLDTGYDRSKISLSIDGTEFAPNSDGTFTVKPTGMLQTVDIKGVELNKYTVTVSAEHAESAIGSTVTVEHGSDLVLGFIADEGYTFSDAKLACGDKVYKAYHDSWFTVPDVESEITVTLSGVVPEQYDITFVKGGEAVETLTAIYGQALTPSDKSSAWYLYGSDEAYDFTKSLSADTVFFDTSASETSKIDVTYYAGRGILSASWIGGDVVSGGTVAKGSDVTFFFDGESSYSVVGWFVNGTYTETTETSITVSDVSDPLYVVAAVEYAQGGVNYILNAPTVLPDEEYSKLFWIGSYQDPLKMGAAYYDLMPSAYTVVGDYLYFVSSKSIQRINLNGDFSDGQMPADTLTITPDNITKSISYFDGYLFVGTAVYDLDLNYLFEAPASPSGMYDGDFISFNSNTVSRWSLDVTESGYKTKTLWKFDVEQIYGSIAIDGDYLYYLSVSTTDPDRSVTSIDLNAGKIKDTVDLNKWIYAAFMDDGRITVSDGWVYVTSYTAGLFDHADDALYDGGTLLRVSVKDGTFEDGSVQTILFSEEQNVSEFVEYNGRGYVYSNNKLAVIDMDSFQIIYTVEGAFTHGSIILNTYYANESNNYKVYVYVVPYKNSETVWVFEDDQTKTSGTVSKIEKTGYEQYSTTSIKSSASGYIYWYNDSSIFFVTGAKYHDVTFVSDGIVISTNSRSVNGEALVLPETPVKGGYTFRGWYNYDGTEITAGSKAAGDMTIIAVWEPKYAVTFVIDGKIETTLEDRGTEVMLPSEPVKASDGLYDYTFVRWDGYTDGMEVSEGGVTITAVFSKALSANTESDATVKADGGKATLTKEEVKYLAESGKKTVIESETAKIEIPAEVFAGLAAGKEVSVKVAKVSAGSLNESQKKAVGNAQIISFSLTAGTESVHKLSKAVAVTIPADQLQVPANSNTVVYYVDGDGSTEAMATTVNDDGSLTFTTNHFSYYFIGEAASAEGASIVVIALAAIVVVALIALVIYGARSREEE